MTTTTERTGTVHVKASKLDPVYQTFLVRESEGVAEYWHKQLFVWYVLPTEWASKVVWDSK